MCEQFGNCKNVTKTSQVEILTRKFLVVNFKLELM